jgi:hypothetical protein
MSIILEMNCLDRQVKTYQCVAILQTANMMNSISQWSFNSDLIQNVPKRCIHARLIFCIIMCIHLFGTFCILLFIS